MGLRNLPSYPSYDSNVLPVGLGKVCTLHWIQELQMLFVATSSTTPRLDTDILKASCTVGRVYGIISFHIQLVYIVH
jgi:hypothetical protein